MLRGHKSLCLSNINCYLNIILSTLQCERRGGTYPDLADVSHHDTKSGSHCEVKSAGNKRDNNEGLTEWDTLLLRCREQSPTLRGPFSHMTSTPFSGKGVPLRYSQVVGTPLCEVVDDIKGNRGAGPKI